MPINTDFIDELKEGGGVATLETPRDYIAPPKQPKKRVTGINVDFINSLKADDHPEVIENKAKIIREDTLPVPDFFSQLAPEDPQYAAPAVTKVSPIAKLAGEVVGKPVEKLERAIKGFWNKGVAVPAHELGKSDNPALYKAYEVQKARMVERKKAGQGKLAEVLLNDEFKDITWQLGLRPEARDDEDLKKIKEVYSVGEDVNPFPQFNIPPGQDPGDYIADTVAGIGSFLAQLYFLRKVLPGTPSQVIWEIQNIATGGTPGRGAAINTALKSISQIPTVSKIGKGTKVAAGGGLFGGLTYAEGGDFVDIAVSTAIGMGFQAWDIHKQNQWLKSFRSHLRKAEYAKMQEGVAKGNREVQQVYQQNLATGMKPAEAKAKYQRALKGVTNTTGSELERQSKNIDKAMDIIARKLHHGKLKGREAELAKEIVAKGLTPEAAAEVAKTKLLPKKRVELAKKGYGETTGRLFKLKPEKGAPVRDTIQVVRDEAGTQRAVYPTEAELRLPKGWTVTTEPIKPPPEPTQIAPTRPVAETKETLKAVTTPKAPAIEAEKAVEGKVVEARNYPTAEAFIESQRPKKVMNVSDIDTQFQGIAPNAEGEIEGIMEAIEAGKDVPPILVSKNGFLQNGRHRLEAYKRLGVEEITVSIGIDPSSVEGGKFVDRLTKIWEEAKPPAKEAWEMTQVYVNSEKSKKDFPVESKVEVIDGKPVYKYWTTLKWDGKDRTFSIKRKGNMPTDVFSKLHKKVVEAALSEGKPVPRAVLEEYKGESWAKMALKEQKYDSQKKEGLVRGEPQGEEPRRPVQVEEGGEGEIGAGGIFQAPELKLQDDVINYLKTGHPLAAKWFFRMADKAYGGTRAEGKYGVSDAYDVLETAVNLHIKNLAHPPQGNIDYAVSIAKQMDELLSRLPSQTNRGGEKDKYQQFSTPPHYSYAINWIANIGKNDVVLEPEAGTGSLLVHAINMKPLVAKVYANELSKRRAKLLEWLGADQIFTEDAEQLHNILPENVRPTVVIMNPPFSRAPERMGDKKVIGTDLKHIEASLKFLQDGGRLVAIMGRKMREEEGENRNFQDWITRIKKEYNVKANIYVNAGVYRKYGTSFPTRVLVIDKTGPTTGEIKGGKVDNIEELLYNLEGVRNERTAAKQEPTGEVVSPAAERGEAAAEPRPSTQPATGEVPTGELRPARPLGETTARPVRAGEPSVRVQRPSEGAKAPARRPEGERVTGAEEEVAKTRHISGREHIPEPAIQHTETIDTITVGTEKHKRLPKKESGDLVFESYQSRKFFLPGSKEHPASLVESRAMAVVDPPDVHYELAMPKEIVEKGQLSNIQLEAVAYAGQAHEQFLPENEKGIAQRKGYFIGDGTGLGKGREIAGVLLDNWNHGRKKALWISESKDLINAAKRDWEGIGQQGNVIFGIPGNYENIRTKKGIMFLTYSTLRGKSKDEQPKKRLDQVIDWVGEDFDGVIVFDESHNMANVTRERGQRGWTEPSQRALAGLELQNRLPNARVVYSSATGATEVRNLLYATRLGLWGAETPFPGGSSFISEMASGGIANMELVARDMKALGIYTSRSISYNDGTEKGTVKYERLEHVLTPEQRVIYDKLAEGWQITLQNIEEALKITGANMSGNAKGAAKSAFWGAHQRFFNQIITAMQTPSVINRATEDLKGDNSVVIQLTNTQEAAQERALAKLGKGQDLEDFDVTPRDILMQLVEHSFPVTQYETYMDENGNEVSRIVEDSRGNPIQNREAIQKREFLLDQLGSIRVPESPLDMIINHFGMDNVAEVTGRKRRVIQKLQEDGTKKKVIDKRNKASNRADINAFMNGKKRILIFSEAGGTGVSYHADNDAKNIQHRVHYLLQPGWRADKALQGLGRTHRSNQASAPSYILVTTDLKGQKRFISSIARRLAQLGALTRGERKAGESGIFTAADNLESHEAKDALRVFWRDLANGDIENISLAEFEDQTGLVLRDRTGNLRQTLPPIRQFLNRLLSLNVDMQNDVFEAYEERLISKVEQAIENGTLDQGMETYKADNIEKIEEQVVYTHPQSNTETKYVKLKIYKKNKPITWETITGPSGYNADRFVQSSRGKIYAVFHAHAATDATTGRIIDRYRLMPPNGHSHFEDHDKIDYGYNWTKLIPEEAKPIWNEEFGKVPEYKESDEHFLTGLIMPIWDKIRGKARIYHILTDEGEDMIGRTLHPNQVATTLKALGAELDEKMTTEEAFNRILQGNIEAELDNQWKIRYARVQGEDRIELIGPSFAHDTELTSIGIFKERITYDTRYFVPTENVTNFDSLTRRHKIVDVIYLSTDEPQTDIPAYGGGGFVRFGRGPEGPVAKVSAIVKEDLSTGSKAADSFLERTKGFTSSGQPGVLTKALRSVGAFFREFHYLPELPKQPEYADIREHFRHTEEIKRLAWSAATEKMKWALEPIKGIKQELRARFRSLEMKLVADDLQEDVDNGVQLPPDLTAADVKIMKEKAQQIYDKYPSVRESYNRLRQVCSQVGDMLVEEGMLDADRAKEYYFPHRVIKYLRTEDAFFGIPTRKPAQYKPGYLKQRKGGYDYSTDIMERLVEHWAQVQRDVTYRQFLEKVLMEEQTNWFREEYPEWTQWAKDESGKRIRNLIPEGYREVTVLPGRYYYSTYGVTEDMARAIVNQNLDAIEEIFDSSTAQQIRRVLALGKKRSFIVREPIARQIHDMPTRPISTNPAYLAVKGFHTFIKGQILFNPLYSLPFHLTNFIGDTHKVLVALPSALKGKYLANYWREIIAAHRGGKSERFELAQKLGVVGSGWIGVDVTELKTIMPEIEKAEISGAGKLLANKIKRYWNLSRKAGSGREDWLRYALFDRLLDLQQQGKDISKYAIKDKSLVKAIADPDAQAAKVARDIAGDYAAIGKSGRMLSDVVILFYRWMHLNLPWWPRMVKEYAKKGQVGRLIYALLAAAFPYIASMLWNYSSEERRRFERTLPPWKRWNFHIVGLHGKKMYYVPLPLDDLMNFIGIPEDMLDIQRYQKGMINGPELIKRIIINSTYEPGMSVVNAVGGVPAIIRDAIGWQTFPDWKDYRITDWKRKGLNIGSDIFGAPGQVGKALRREGISIDPETGDIILGQKTRDTLNRAWMGIRPYSVDIEKTKKFKQSSVYKRTTNIRDKKTGKKVKRLKGAAHKGKQRLVDSLTIQLKGAD